MNTAENLAIHLPSHGRGHRFNPCRTHHVINGLGRVSWWQTFSFDSRKYQSLPANWYRIGRAIRALIGGAA